ncbi:hypothetical protein [Halodesulfovibrio spirochaetisodalis]|uniref:Uncharacterized protein n=1 Tax=Halodesulfovibrio spirochaetisodalis TaxID=1560234 RepID=A0A1B7XBF5_9BACT|nr:hypothetical protein [Halodesulfovibrio spirochaetisodalis]OBQ46694.1 hypothetical protein SP90_11260 [Halodesulfovibrio spirochaetisodalis]
MKKTFPCSNCDSTVSFTVKNIENTAKHNVLCPHCNTLNHNETIDAVANKVGNRYRRKFTGDTGDTHILIRNEPVEDVNNAMALSFSCTACSQDVTFSPTKVLSRIEHTVTCAKCSTANCNDDIDAQSVAAGSSFIVINTTGKLMPQT